MNTFRFRNRLPRDGEGKQPRAAIEAAVDGTVARIHLYDVIDSWGGYWGTSAKEFTAALGAIGSDVTELRVHINSPGGEVYEAIAILNQLRNHPARVVAVIDGIAASAASFIATGADELVMGENTELMIHDAWGLAIGNAADMRSYAEQLDMVSNNIASIYAKKAGGDPADWRTVMVDERWYSADEAVEAGLADRAGPIETEGDLVDDAAEEIPADDDDELFDIAAMGFKHAGRAEAPAPEPIAAADETPARSADMPADERFRARAARELARTSA